jgi:hypothetical protein
VITVAVRWYLRYGSYRDVEELLAERGIDVDHVTICRWALSGCWVSSVVSRVRAGDGLCGAGGHAVAGRPTTSYQVVNRVLISCRYWTAVSRWRRGRKCGDIPLNADKDRCAPPGEVNFFMARSRCRVGWWEFSARLFRYFDRRCSTLRSSRRWATP